MGLKEAIQSFAQHKQLQQPASEEDNTLGTPEQIEHY